MIVTESSGTSLSKPDTVSGVYRVTEGGAVDLPCIARGRPLPSYTWFKVNPVTGAQEPLSASPSLFPRHSVLSIVGANAGDSGRYICRVHNKVNFNILVHHIQSFSTLILTHLLLFFIKDPAVVKLNFRAGLS